MRITARVLCSCGARPFEAITGESLCKRCYIDALERLGYPFEAAYWRTHD